MGELIGKAAQSLAASDYALALGGAAIILLGIVGKVTSKWFSLNLTGVQRGAVASLGLLLVGLGSLPSIHQAVLLAKIVAPAERASDAVAPALDVTFRDGDRAQVGVAFQMRIDPARIVTTVTNWGSQEAARNALYSALRAHSVSELEKHTLEEVRENREGIARAILAAAATDVERTGHIVDRFFLTEIVENGG